jgi:hypothetical protein
MGPCGNRAKEQEHDDDEQDHSDGHWVSPVVQRWYSPDRRTAASLALFLV